MAKRKSRKKVAIPKSNTLRAAEANHRYFKRLLQSMSKKKTHLPASGALKEARKRETLLRRLIRRTTLS